jgi:hypothetical protein
MHTRLPFAANVAPLTMLSTSLLFLFHGPGPCAVETWWADRRASRVTRGSLHTVVPVSQGDETPAIFQVG